MAASASRPLQTAFPKPAWAEQDSQVNAGGWRDRFTNGGTIQHAQGIAARASPRTTKRCRRRGKDGLQGRLG